MRYRKIPLSEVKPGDVIAHHDESGRAGEPVWNTVTSAPVYSDPKTQRDLEFTYDPVEEDPHGLYFKGSHAQYPADAEVLIQE
jgi:hypothetical protein